MIFNFKGFVIGSVLIILSNYAVTAQYSTETISKRQYEVNRTGMTVLSGWAILNIGVGLGAMRSTNGQTKYFHQMNALWNTINLGLGAVGYFTASSVLDVTTLGEVLDNQMNFEKILLVNAGLDVGYIMTGFFLKERALNKSSDRLRGFGNSLLLQGSFLMVFDIMMYAIHHTNYAKIIEGIDQLSLGINTMGGVSFGLTVPF